MQINVELEKKRPGENVISTLLKFSNRLHPRMIFLGSYGAGGEKANQLGSVSLNVCLQSPANTCLVRNYYPAPDPKVANKFVVAVDGRTLSIHALRETISLARKQDIIHVRIASVHCTVPVITAPHLFLAQSARPAVPDVKRLRVLRAGIRHVTLSRAQR